MYGEVPLDSGGYISPKTLVTTWERGTPLGRKRGEMRASQAQAVPPLSETQFQALHFYHSPEITMLLVAPEPSYHSSNPETPLSYRTKQLERS